jgi:hypothetical protein
MSREWPKGDDTAAVLSLFPPNMISEERHVIKTEGVIGVYQQLYGDYIKLQRQLANSNAQGMQLQEELAAATQKITNLEAIGVMGQKNCQLLEEQVAYLKKQLPTENASQSGSDPKQPPAPDVILRNVIAKEKALQLHRPKLYDGKLDQLLVVDFLEDVEVFVRMGAGGGQTVDDRCIDVALRHVGKLVLSWIDSTWARRYPDNKIPQDYQYACPWAEFKAEFIGRFISAASRTKVRIEWENLRCTGDPQIFNERCRSLLRLITEGSSIDTILQENDIFRQYCRKLPSRWAETILQAAQLRKDMIKWAPAAPSYNLQDAMLAFEEQKAMSAAHNTTSITQNTSFNQNVDLAPDPDAMDLSAINSSVSIQCYNCKGYGHLSKSCPTPDNRERSGLNGGWRRNWRYRGVSGRGTGRGGSNPGQGKDLVKYQGNRKEVMLVDETAWERDLDGQEEDIRFNFNEAADSDVDKSMVDVDIEEKDSGKEMK